MYKNQIKKGFLDFLSSLAFRLIYLILDRYGSATILSRMKVYVNSFEMLPEG